MPEVGVLNLTIRDNSDDAGKGLDRLAAALSAVKAAKARFDLGIVGKQVTELAKTIQQTKGTSTIIKNLGTMFNAINKFSQLKDFTIDAEKLRDTAMYMNKIADGMARMNEARQASVHGGGAHDMYCQMVEEVKTVKDAIEQTADSVEKNSHRIFGLQIFASRGTKKSPGQIGMDLDGLEKQTDLFKETKETIDYATGAVDKFKDTAANLAGPVKAIDLEKYIGSPLESIINKVQMGGTAMERFWDSLAIKFPTVSVEAMEKAVAGNAALAKAEIAGLFKMLEKPIKYKGLGEFIKAKTGITHAAQGSGINENTTMFKPISETIGGTTESVERVQEATSGMVKMFDAVSGAYKEMYVDGNAAVESNNKIAESMERISSTMQEGISLMNMPASGKNGTFANASEEMQYLTERIEEAKLAQQQFNDIAANAEKQMKYGGPMKSEELEFNLRHATEGFYQAAEAEEVYKAALHDLMTYAAQTAEEMRRATDTAVETPVAQSVENLNAVMNEASNDGLEKFKSEMDEIVNATTPALSKIELLQNKAKFLKDKLARLYEMPATDELGNDTGRNNAINETLLKIGAVNEQIQKMVDKAHEAQEALQFDTMKGEAASQITPWAMTDVDNLVNQYNEIDLLTMKMEGMKQALLDDINQNKLDTQQIAERTIAIQNLKDKIEELKNAQEEASSIHGKLGSAMDSFREGMKKAFPVISGLLKRFKSMMIMRSLRYVIRQIASGLSEGVKNVYYYSQAVGTSFAPAMDSAATSLKQMKNSIGAALAPAIQALIPVLQSVVGWFINLVNYANQFFALLNGQSTWTRALPQATTAFKDQTKAAKGASSAMKDLLADWDELNIIQSQNNGGGGGAGTAAEDYETMFEEVAAFDEKIKETVQWIQDHMETIKDVALAIGAGILTWKISRAFGDTLSSLQRLELAAGIVLLVRGIEVSADTGYDIGKNGINNENILNAVKGILETAAGGALIGFALTKTAAGGLLGMSLGVTVALLIMSAKVSEGEHDALYGDTQYTVEEIQKEVDELFTFDVDAKFNEATVDFASLNRAKEDVIKKLNNTNKKYKTLQLKLDTQSAKELADSVQETVTSANALLKEYQTAISVGFGFSTMYEDPEGVQKFSTTKLTELEGYIQGLGNDIGKILEDGIVDAVSEKDLLDDLMRKLTNVANAITLGQLSGEFAIDIEEAGKGIDWANATRENVIQYGKTYSESVEKVREAAEMNAKKTKSALAGIYYGMQQREIDNPGTYTTEELKQAEENWRNYNIESVTDTDTKNAIEEGRKIFMDNMLLALTGAMNNVKNNSWFTTGSSEMKGMNLSDWINTNLASVLYGGKFGDEKSKEFINVLDIMEVKGWDILTDDLKKKYINSIEKALGKTANTYNRLKDELGVPVTDLLIQKKDAWDTWSATEQKSYISALSKAYGGREVVEAFKKAGYSVEDLLDTASLFTGSTQESFVNALEEVFGVSIKKVMEDPDAIAPWWKGTLLGGVASWTQPKAEKNATEDTLDNINEKTEFKDINQLYTKLKGIVLDSGADYLDQLDYMADLVELFNSKDFDTLLRLYQEIKDKDVGVDNAFEMYENYKQGFGWSNGTDVGWMPTPVHAPAMEGGFNEAPLEMEADIDGGLDEQGVATGVQIGNRDQNEILNSILLGVRALLNKPWNVNVTPSTAFGIVAGASAVQLSKVTGDIP